jgi:CRISPR/Cas system-associated exonuclease Cas4 (RecB family)
MFYLTYIKRADRENNFFGEYGSFIHKLLEEYFSGNMEIDDMVEYYEKNYSINIITSPPPYPKGMAENYYNSGLDFFADFNSYGIRRENYEILEIEESTYTGFDDISLVIKPDIILKNKKTGKITLIDYKTARKDDKKIEAYKKQLLMYTYFLWSEKQLEVDNIKIWFIKSKEFYTIEKNPHDVITMLDWIKSVRNKITEERNFEPNLSKDNEYFCSNICSMRLWCEYKNGTI